MIAVRHNVVSSMRASMGDDFLRRVRRTSLILGSAMAIMFAFYFGLMPAVAWTAGLVWSLLNIATIRSIVRRVVTTDGRDAAAIVTAVSLKFPILYAAAVVMLLVLKMPPLWWMAGFSWPLFVIVMKSAARIYLRLDETA